MRRMQITRRDLVALLAALPISTPTAGHAQQRERIPRIGYFTSATGSPRDLLGVLETRALVEGLRELGWFDGRNISIEHRFSGTGPEHIRASAKELAALSPDVIISVGGPQLGALLAETRTIPIVFTMVNDPVGAGYVASLAQPGGNATGFRVSEAPLAGKWLELLREIAPQVARALVLPQADAPSQQLWAQTVAAAAPALGITVVTAPVRELADYDREIEAFARQPGGGLVVLPNPIMAFNQERIHALAALYRLPAVHSYPIYARTGGLVSYGPDPASLFHQAAGYIDKILRGAKPGDLPVQQPTRILLVVNLKTARALSLTIPQSILDRADEVIE
jgi:putative tryptophan/tyrosine transport system substrate-binding protein